MDFFCLVGEKNFLPIPCSDRGHAEVRFGLLRDIYSLSSFLDNGCESTIVPSDGLTLNQMSDDRGYATSGAFSVSYLEMTESYEIQRFFVKHPEVRSAWYSHLRWLASGLPAQAP